MHVAIQTASTNPYKIVAAPHANGQAGFDELHAIYSKRLYRTIVAITKNPDDAEDVLQETFLRAYLARDTFEGRSSIYSWLTRIAINSALMLLRKRRVRPEFSFDSQPDDRGESTSFEVRDCGPDPEELCAQHQHQLKTLRELRRLRPQLREPIWMQVTHGWSIKEIGRALSISDAAVKARLHRARRQLSVKHDERRAATLA